MLKAGLIGAGIGFVLAIIAALITPFCNPCLALILGLGIGALAAAWERPVTSGTSAGQGAKAGAIAAAGGLVGQMVGAVANGFIVGPTGAADLVDELGIDMPVEFTSQSYWIYNIGSNCLCAVGNVALGAGLGALGGLLWYQISKNQPPTGSLESTL